ncbi:hypothetical protein UF75_3975 [Desulfosporosinus sp. I2]|nr:hypothetical protein UF75_3975 [Desulfosporosinus sp. I2]
MPISNLSGFLKNLPQKVLRTILSTLIDTLINFLKLFAEI